MGGLTDAPAKFRFGVFELDFATGELRKNGIRVRLHDQPYRILSVLLAQPGQLVTRDDLRRALWPDETFVDFDHGLNSGVNKLREALGDSASNPRYVETVPRRGYRFIAPVEAIAVTPPPPVPPPAEPKAPSPARTWHWVLAATIAVAVTGYSLSFRRPSPPFRLSIVTSYPGHEVLPSLSPDGRQVAFAWDGEGESNYDIYVKPVGAEHPIRLTTDPAMDTNPVWSPDGSSIAFLRVRLPETLEILLAPALGGPERKIAELRQPGMFDATTQPGGAYTYRRRQIAWLPDGKWLVARDTPPGGDPGSLFLISTSTGEKRRLTSPPANGVSDRSPSMSPDGRRIAFVRGPWASGSQIYLLELDSNLTPKGDPVKLTSESWTSENPVWTADGREIVFSAGAMHNPGLWRMPASVSASPRRIFEAGDGALQPMIAESRLMYVHSNYDVNIWRVQFGDREADTRATRLIASTYVDHHPEYSPDGRRVGFISNRTGGQEMWAVDADGSNAARLTSYNNREVLSLHWSPDGKRIVFQVGSGEQAEIHAIDSDGAHPRNLIRDRGLGSPSWSQDGQWTYLVRQSAGQILRFPAGTGEAQALGTPPPIARGVNPRESRDGKFLYYSRNKALWRIPLTGGDEQQMLPPVLSYPVNFAITDRGVYFVSSGRDGQKDSLQFRDFATGRTTVAHILDKPVMWGLTASPDGRSVLFAQQDFWGTDLKLLDDFR